MNWSNPLVKNTRTVLILSLLVFITGCVFIFINYGFSHYSGFNYLPLRWIIVAPIIFILLLLALYAEDKTPRLAFFTLTYTTYFFVLLACAVLTNGIQYTPFFPIDRQLLAIDQLLGFHTTALIHWTAQHHFIQKIFESLYEFLNIEIILIPFLLGFFMEKNAVYDLFLMMLIAFFIGGLIYYFFPTAAPASVLNSPYFLSVEKDTALKFYQIHHHLSVTTGEGGLIAFPSFHVVWAILLCGSLYNKKWLFYPCLVINFFIILSTLFLGWHYLVDVIAAIFLVFVTFFIVRHLKIMRLV